MLSYFRVCSQNEWFCDERKRFVDAANDKYSLVVRIDAYSCQRYGVEWRDEKWVEMKLRVCELI